MSERSLVQATLQLPCSVVIISASADSNQGATIATAMYVSQVPSLIAVSISKTFTTYQLIEKSKEFSINVIADNQLELAKQFGRVHGYEFEHIQGYTIDKLREFGIAIEPASNIGASLISGCFANIECVDRQR